MTDGLRIVLLGRFELRSEDATLIDHTWARGKAKAVLTVLALAVRIGELGWAFALEIDRPPRRRLVEHLGRATPARVPHVRGTPRTPASRAQSQRWLTRSSVVSDKRKEPRTIGLCGVRRMSSVQSLRNGALRDRPWPRCGAANCGR